MKTFSSGEKSCSSCCWELLGSSQFKSSHFVDIATFHYSCCRTFQLPHRLYAYTVTRRLAEAGISRNLKDPQKMCNILRAKSCVKCAKNVQKCAKSVPKCAKNVQKTKILAFGRGHFCDAGGLTRTTCDMRRNPRINKNLVIPDAMPPMTWMGPYWWSTPAHRVNEKQIRHVLCQCEHLGAWFNLWYCRKKATLTRRTYDIMYGAVLVMQKVVALLLYGVKC
jgi:hypothetical protein